MGYTHYWRLKEGISNEEGWLGLCRDAESILDHSDLQLSFCVDTMHGYMNINGIGKEGYESFHFTVTDEGTLAQYSEWAGGHFAFCKTARNPYDVVVCAILIAAKHWFGEEIRVSSDGTWNGEWTNGAWEDCKSPAALYEQATGRRALNPLSAERAAL